MKTLCKYLLLLSVLTVILASIVPYGSHASKRVIFSVGLDKIFHCLAFAWIIFLAFGTMQHFDFKSILRVVGAVLIFGIIIEFLQYPIPYRTFNPLDIFANICGILSGLSLWLILRVNHEIY